MRIRFLPKASKNTHNYSEVDRLIYIIKGNRKLIELTMQIISEECETKDIKEIIEIDGKFLSCDYTKEYEELLSKIYTYDNGKLGNYRGAIFEGICTGLIFYKDCDCTDYDEVFKDCKVEYNGTKINDKDVDLVFKHCTYEILECKISLNSFIRYPISKNADDKINLLEQSVNKCKKEKLKANAYFVTASTDIKDELKELLQQKNIEALCQEELLKRLFVK